MTDQQPVLPAVPWYESPVQVRLVSAGISGAISVVFRTIDLLGFELQVKHIDVDALGANLAQGVALVFVGLAWWKRQRSAVAPLTFTATGAAAHAVSNPPLLDSDPTKLPKEAKP
jgi:hypothetical protein